MPVPDIKRFIAMSVDSSCCLIEWVGLVPIDGLLNLPASFFIIKSPIFSAVVFLPNSSPACEIPDCSAFLANGLTTVLATEDATLLTSFKYCRQLYHCLCANTQIYPALGEKLS